MQVNMKYCLTLIARRERVPYSGVGSIKRLGGGVGAPGTFDVNLVFAYIHTIPAANRLSS